MYQKMGSLVVTGLLAGVVLGQGTGTQTAPPAHPDPWGAFRQLEGNWRGSGNGQPGVSTSERNYSFILGGKFLHGRNRGVYNSETRLTKSQ